MGAVRHGIAPSEAFTLEQPPGVEAGDLPGLRRALHLRHGVEQLLVDGPVDRAARTTPTATRDRSPTPSAQVIIEVWQRVAQDFAPFDVNVTTQDPGEDAINRADTTDDLVRDPGADLPGPDRRPSAAAPGSAYVDVFDNTTNGYYQPAWVFPQNLGNAPRASPTPSATRPGTYLGLHHDGTSTSAYYYGGRRVGPDHGHPVQPGDHPVEQRHLPRRQQHRGRPGRSSPATAPP